MSDIDNLPRDADGDAIRRVVENGADLSRPMDIDIAVAFTTRAAGTSFAKKLLNSDYRTSVERDGEGSAWTCYCMKSMVLNYEAVIASQQELDDLARPLGGHVDGWGTFGNT